MRISDQDFQNRIASLQEEMERRDIDLFVGYASESEPAVTRYLADFAPFFDFAGVIVPREGEAALITGGPESYEMAVQFSRIRTILIHGMFVETSAPEWIPDAEIMTFSEIIPRVSGSRAPRRIALANQNIFPYPIYQDLLRVVGDVEVVSGDDMLLAVRSVKSSEEIEVIREAYRITEEAVKHVFNMVRPGLSEQEIELEGRRLMLQSGVHETSYPIWVVSGPNTRLSLGKSTDRRIQRNELVQITFGARYQGYCGNMCRPFVLGTPDRETRKLMDVGIEAMEYALSAIRPGVRAPEVFRGYHDILARYGWEKFTLYGPAHGTGVSEVEGLWLAENADFVIEPGMVFNVDIWLSDNMRGLRFEDGIVVTEDGIEELADFRREVIILDA